MEHIPVRAGDEGQDLALVVDVDAAAVYLGHAAPGRQIQGETWRLWQLEVSDWGAVSIEAARVLFDTCPLARSQAEADKARSWRSARVLSRLFVSIDGRPPPPDDPKPAGRCRYCGIRWPTGKYHATREICEAPECVRAWRRDYMREIRKTGKGRRQA